MEMVSTVFDDFMRIKARN